MSLATFTLHAQGNHSYISRAKTNRSKIYIYIYDRFSGLAKAHQPYSNVCLSQDTFLKERNPSFTFSVKKQIDYCFAITVTSNFVSLNTSECQPFLGLSFLFYNFLFRRLVAFLSTHFWRTNGKYTIYPLHLTHSSFRMEINPLLT